MICIMLTDTTDDVWLSQVPKSNTIEWKFHYTRLVSVKRVVNDNECVTKQQAVTLRGDIFDGKNKKITIILAGTLPNYLAVVNLILKYEVGSLKQGDSKHWFFFRIERKQ